MGNQAWPSVGLEDQIWTELRQRGLRQQAMAASATPTQAVNAAGLADAYPWLDAGVIQSLTLANQGPDSQTARKIAEAAASIDLEDGAFDEPANQVPDNQFDSLWDAVSTNVGHGLLNLSRGAIAILAAPFEEVAERVAPAVFGAEQATEPLFDPGNLGDNIVADVAEQPANIAASLSRLLRGGFWTTFWDKLTNEAAPSTLALAIGDIANPDRSPQLFGFDKEKGEGLLANFERRQQFRNRITIPGATPTAEDPWANTATLGRVIARDVTEPGTEPYKTLSGLFDFGVNLAPVDMGLGKVAKGAKVATGLGSRADIIAAGGRAGLLPGVKKSVDLDGAVDGFLTSRVGGRMVDWFTDETDFLKIWERVGRNSRVARELQKANTRDKVIKVFQDNLGTTLRETPTAGPVSRAAGDVLSGDYGRVFGAGATMKRSLSNLRWTHEMPVRPLNPHNIDDAARTAHDFMRNARLGDERTSYYLQRIASLEDGDSAGLYRIVVDDLFAETAETLINRGSTPLSRPMTRQQARRITRAWSDDIEDSRAFFIDEAGRNADLAPARNVIDGKVHDLKPVAHLMSERLANSIPLPDVGEIKRAASFYNRVWDIPGVSDSVALADFVFGSAWKAMQLVTRLAYPVRVIGEEQIRLAGVGMASGFRHPVDYLSWVVGTSGNGPISRGLRKLNWESAEVNELGVVTSVNRRGITPQGGKSVMDDLFTEMDDFRSAMSRGSSVYAGGQGVPAHITNGRFARVDKSSDAYFDGAVTELQQLASDPVAQRVAGGLRKGDARSIGMNVDDPNANTVDAIKEWFYSGTGQRFRKELSEDPNWQILRTGDANTTARQASDEYIDSIVERLNVKTGQDPDLVEAVASGKLGDLAVIGERSFGNERKLAKALEDYEGSLPEFVKVEDFAVDRSRIGQAVEVWNKATDRMFHSLMSVPTNTLSRSPHFRQAYWSRMDELLGYADRPTQEAIIRAAGEAGLSQSRLEDMARIATRTQGTKLRSLEDADMIGRAHALEATRDTLYDLTRRNQFFDSFRLVFPFGEAWKEIFTAWTRILGNNPSMLRRFQQGIEGGLGPGFGDLASEYLGTGTLPGQGFFYEDSNGEMVFNYPGSELASKYLLEEGHPLSPGRIGRALTGDRPAQFAFKGSLTGLNLMSATILPGVGPTVQIPMAMLTEVMQVDVPDALHNIVFPFGTPPVREGIGATLADAYMPAWLQKWETAMGDPDSDRLLANTTMDVMRALVRTGEYDTNSPEAVDELYDAATERASMLFWIRGLAQSTVPTGPGVEWSTEDAAGNMVPLQWMVDEYYKLGETYGFDRAADEFLRRFGADNLLALQGKTRELVPRPLTEEGAGWLDDHPELERRYPLSVGLIAPDPVGGAFDYNAYLETIRDDTRQQLTPREMVALSNSFKGRLAYEHLKTQVEGRTDAQAALWLAGAKQQLAEEYPGFDGYIPLESRPDEQDYIAELERMVADPDVADLPTVEGVRLYLEARAAAQRVVDENSERLDGSKGFTRSASTEFLREWLRATAEEITDAHPEFAPVWEHVFSRELVEDE